MQKISSWLLHRLLFCSIKGHRCRRSKNWQNARVKAEIQAKTCIDFWEEYQSKSSSHWQLFFPWPHLHLFRQKNWNCSYCPVLKRHEKFLQAVFCQLFLILTVPKPFLWDSVNLNVKAMRSHRLGGKKERRHGRPSRGLRKGRGRIKEDRGRGIKSFESVCLSGCGLMALWFGCSPCLLQRLAP